MLTDLVGAEKNYESSLKDVRDADENLTLAEFALYAAQKSGNQQELTDATKAVKDARTALSVATKQLGDDTCSRISTTCRSTARITWTPP